jgi:hypothetical protein
VLFGLLARQKSQIRKKKIEAIIIKILNKKDQKKSRDIPTGTTCALHTSGRRRLGQWALLSRRARRMCFWAELLNIRVCWLHFLFFLIYTYMYSNIYVYNLLAKIMGNSTEYP